MRGKLAVIVNFVDFFEVLSVKHRRDSLLSRSRL